jgi:alpha-mannosidase
VSDVHPRRDPKQLSLRMIGYSHIDPVWLWQWQEGLGEVKATFRSALDRMAEYPEFHFSISSAAFHEFMELNEPEMFEEIRERVAEGRWEIVGGWWVEPDANLPSGESFARHALYGQRYFGERVGARARVGFDPDAFGHCATLPQLLRLGGMDGYVFMRPQINEKDMPRLFWWESPDGSRVLAFRIVGEYNSPAGTLDDQVALCLPELGDPLPELACFYGVGDHGGGPTRANIESIRDLDARADMPRLIPGTVTGFLDGMRERLDRDAIPVWRDEIQHHAPGCYSAHSGMKRWNRQAEQALLSAEKLATVAWLVAGQRYPTEFRRAWTDVLFDQMHDILPGTSLEPAYDDARDATGEALSIAARAQHFAVQAIGRRIDIPETPGTSPIVVFNPHPWAVRARAELELGGLRDGDRLLDDADREIPYQPVRSLAAVTGWRHRLCFVADLPPLGYRTYRLISRSPEERSPAARREAARPGAPVSLLTRDPGPHGEGEGRDVRAGARAGRALENQHLRVDLDPDDGTIALVARRDGREVAVIPGGGARPVPIRDPSDTWGHRMYAFRDAAGTFELHGLWSMEEGAVRASIRTEHRWRDSRITQDFLVYRDLPWVEVLVAVEWSDRFTALKLAFPTAMPEPVATFEIPYGHITRPTTGGEEPGQAWADVSGEHRDGGRAGLGLVNDAKYAYDVLRDELRLTVLRSAIYAHHEPYAPHPDGPYPFQDQGRQRFSYVLVPHEGDWRAMGLPRIAAEMTQRPVTSLETFHSGPLPQAQGYLEVGPSSVVATVLKRAEDGDDLVVRLHETHGRPARVGVRFPAWDRSVEADLGAHRILTLRVPRDPAAEVVEVDFLEETLAGS